MGERKVGIIGLHRPGALMAAALLDGQHVVTIDSRRSGKTHREEIRKELELRILSDDPPPPTRLSIDPNSEDFHPCYVRVGVTVDGKDRNDLQWYDSTRLEYMTTDKTSHLATSIEPYWRYSPTRQQRRAEQRWEAKRK